MSATIFRAAQAAAASVLDTVFGEPFIVFPLTFVGGAHANDPQRASLPVTAILTEKSIFSAPIGQRNGAGMSKNIVSEHASTASMIEIARAALPYGLKAKDRLQRVEDGAVFEISGVENDDLDHVTYRVMQLSAP